MNEDQFNKFFRDTLLNHPSPVPDDMWEKIKGKKKRRFLVWWLFSGILLISFTAGYFFMQTNTNKHNKENDTSLVKQETGPVDNTDAGSISTVRKKVLKKPGKEKKEIAEKDTKYSSDNTIINIPRVVTKDVYLKGKQHKNDDRQNLIDDSTNHSYTKKNRVVQKQKINITIANSPTHDNTSNETDSSTIDNKGNEKTEDRNDIITKVNIAKPASLVKDSSKRNIMQKGTPTQKNKIAARKSGIFLTAYFSTGIPINTFISDNTYYSVAY
jgi:hypothetical protein